MSFAAAPEVKVAPPKSEVITAAEALARLEGRYE